MGLFVSRVAVAGLCLAALQQTSLAQDVESVVLSGMKWRSIGPYRGGRSIAVAGSKARPDEYYFGATGGGLWKTTDAGENWSCVSDGFFTTGSVGAVAVSESNPDIVYAGTGEGCVRGNISHGDGVYRSTDGGKTWAHVGLKETQTVARIRIHPKNPDVVYVAALGHVYGPNPERGVFKSEDGGKNWRKVLFVGERAGAVDLCMDAANPDVLYAATWEMWRTPYSLNSGGPGSKLWKSTDGGATWTDISRNPGLPTGTLGRIGVSVSPADPKRVYACIEALDGGIFVSDDAGAAWKLVSDNRNYRQRAWYYTHIYADPKAVDTVYVLNVGFGKSTDGGKTFSGVSVPHSDNHDLWLNPDDPNIMANANDGGANVSKDGGRTWTEQDLPTAQFYHVATDNHYPYRIYGAQQDNSTVRIASRTFSGGIGRADWTSTAGGESGYIAAKPDDPEIVFGGSYGGYLEMLNHRTGQSRNINVWPDNPMGHGAADLAHRVQWTFPIVFSPHDPNLLYTASQYLLSSTNGGQTWKKLSPDLTRNDKSTMGPSGGPITKDNTSVEYYGTIFTVAESPKRRGVIWCGSDDGLVHVTRDGGKKWENVTPAGMPKWGLCSMIEASPHDPATAFLAVDNHENDDLAPYIYITRDYGKTWTKSVAGIPGDQFVRVVREDPERKGLLFAGTERGVFVSFDSGPRWRSLQSNLPVTPIHDLVIKEGDVVVATHGRSFWVLDDISPLRQLGEARSARAAFVFAPAPAVRTTGGGGFGGGRRGRGEARELMGQNPPGGIVVHYYLAKPADSVQIEVRDAKGTVIGRVQDAPKSAGFHRVSVRSLSYPSFRGFPGMILWAAGARPIPAPPGVYKVAFQAKGSDWSEQLMRDARWMKDPRSSATDADLVAQFELARKVSARTSDANDAVVKIREIKKQIDAAVEASKSDADVGSNGESLKTKLEAIESEIYQVKNRSGQDPLNYPIKLNNKIAALLGVVLSGDFRPTDQAYEVFESLSSQLQVQLDALRAVLEYELKSYNELLKSKNIPAVDPDKAPSSGGRSGG